MKHKSTLRSAIGTAASAAVLVLTLTACASYGSASSAGGGGAGSVTDRKGGQVAEKRMQAPVRWRSDADLLARPGRS